jgi:hypothetical protein
MSLPEATLTIKDNALGLIESGGDKPLALVGTSSAGTPNVVQSFSDVGGLRDALGSGPLVEAAAHVLNVAGGPVVVVKTTTSTAGSNGTVTLTGTGLSVLTASGTPLDTYDVRVKVVSGGSNPASGVVVIRYSLDGGRTWSNDIALPTSGILSIPGTGLTLTFSAASLVADDVYAYGTTGPSFTVSDMNTALDALLGDPNEWFAVLAVGVPADASAGLAIAGSLDAKMTAAANAYRYVYAIMNAEDASDSALKTNYANFASTRVQIAAGFANVVSAINGASYRRPYSYVAAARAAAVAPSEDLGRVASGPTAGVVGLSRDEYRTPGLDAARFTTGRTFIGRQGYYVTNGRLMAPSGSDFQYVPNRRVMDIGSGVIRDAMLNYLNDSVRVDSVTGKILEQDAQSIELRVAALMRAALTETGYASEVSVAVDRTINILSTGRLVVRGRILPRAYGKHIEIELGFTNPALQAAAA